MTAPDFESATKKNLAALAADEADLSNSDNIEAGGMTSENLKPDELAMSGTNFGGGAFQRAVELEPGTVIGGAYRIIKLLGRGGMGQVYLAAHLALDKKCALKVMPSNFVTEKAWKRFQAEAKTISGLDHPNIVRVTDLGIHSDSLPYFAMEYVDGQSLAQLIASRDKLDTKTAVEVLSQICDGIECAHKQGIVHRDLKPANIMLVKSPEDGSDENTRVKILDFGLAKLSQKDAADVNLTATGELFGSPLYMSPEQCAGENTDARSDIYSLGCTIFECLTGRPPFTGERALPVMNRKMLEESPTLSAVAGTSKFTPSLEYLVAKMLKKDPAERYQSIAELKADLQAAQRGEPLEMRHDHHIGQPATLAQRIRERTEDGVASPSHRVRRRIYVAGAVMVVGLLAFSFRIPTPSPIANTMTPAGVLDVPDYVGAEGWLSRIRACQEEIFNPSSVRMTSQRRTELQSITSDAQAHLKALGAKAIPAAIADFASQSRSSYHSGQVLKDHAVEATDPLIKLMMDRPDLSGNIAPILAKAGAPASNKLCAMIGNEKGQTRAAAIEILAQMVKPKMPIYTVTRDRHMLTDGNRSTLLAALHNESDPQLRQQLATTLGYFNSPRADQVAAMSEIIKNDPVEEVRLAAVESMGHMLSGASAYGATDICNTLRDALIAPNQSETMKIACLDALGNNHSGASEEIKKILRAVTKDPVEQIRQKALQTLIATATADPASLGDLRMALGENDSATISRALQAIAKLGPYANPLLPDLLRLNQSSRQNWGSIIYTAIGAVRPETNPQAMNVLYQCVATPYNSRRTGELLTVLRVLQDIGPAAKPALPALKRLADDPTFSWRSYAQRAIDSIEGRR